MSIQYSAHGFELFEKALSIILKLYLIAFIK